MWFDYLPKMNDKGTTVYLFCNGSAYQERKFQHYYTQLLRRNIKRIHMVSSNDSVGARITSQYGRFDQPGVVIIRSNKQVAHSWFGIDLPKVEDIVFRYHQIGY